MTPATRFGALWSVGIAVLLLGLFAIGFIEGVSAGFDPMDGLMAAVFIAVAVPHVVAGAGAWRTRRWAAALGAVLAVSGLAVCLLGAAELWWVGLPAAAGYFTTLLVTVHAVRTWGH